MTAKRRRKVEVVPGFEPGLLEMLGRESFKIQSDNRYTTQPFEFCNVPRLKAYIPRASPHPEPKKRVFLLSRMTFSHGRNVLGAGEFLGPRMASYLMYGLH